MTFDDYHFDLSLHFTLTRGLCVLIIPLSAPPSPFLLQAHFTDDLLTPHNKTTDALPYNVVFI